MTDRDAPKTGYMNPPEQTRFKKGKSGNQQGRPRKPKDLNTLLQKVLNRKVRKIPIRDALIWKQRKPPFYVWPRLFTRRFVLERSSVHFSVLSDECELVSARAVALTLMPRKDRAIQSKRRFGSA